MIKYFCFEIKQIFDQVIKYEILCNNNRQYIKYLGKYKEISFTKEISEEKCIHLLCLALSIQNLYIQLIDSTNIKIFDWLSLTVYLMYFSVWITIIYNNLY